MLPLPLPLINVLRVLPRNGRLSRASILQALAQKISSPESLARVQAFMTLLLASSHGPLSGMVLNSVVAVVVAVAVAVVVLVY